MLNQPEVRSGTPAPVQESSRSNPPNFMFRPVRTHLLAELEQGGKPRPKILAFIAPIGYGKTVLMSELYASLARSGERCFWVGLEDRDTSVERVVRAIEAALSGRGDDPHPMHAPLQGGEPVMSRVDELIERIGTLPAPTTIFIDNLNSCGDEALGALCDALIFRTPASVRFVWSSTVELAIDLGRARLEGLIRRVGLAELSLSAPEARELLGSAVEDSIGASGVAAILRQTEGWPAAIRMAQIVLADADHPQEVLDAFSGSDEDVAALLNRQVLQGFTPELRHFLLCLGQLRTFSSELCRHATGDPASERHVDFLLRRNVFIIPLDRNRKWYRLHGLFREYLLSEAERFLAPEEKRQVLQRAAEWCAQNGSWQDAIDYAFASGETAMVSQLLERTATIFVRDRGDMALYIGWVEHLQARNVTIGWEGHFWYVWALIFHRRYESGRLQQEHLAERLRRQTGTADAAPDDLRQRIDYLGICIDLLTDRLADTYQGAERWLQVEKTNDTYSAGSVEGIKGLCLTSAFRFVQARRSIRAAQRVMHEVGGAYALGWISMAYAILSIYEGDYAQAHKELQAGLARIREELGEDAVLCDTLAFVCAKSAVEMGRDDEAREMLRLGLRKAYSHGLVDAVACGFDAAVKLWNGGSNEMVSIPHLREVAGSYPPRLSLMLSCYLVQRFLRLGRQKEALAEAERIGLGTDGESPAKTLGEPDFEQLAKPRLRELFAATRIDLLIATSRYKEAEALIVQEMLIAKADGRAARLVELGLTRMAIALQAGNSRLAAKELTLAVSRAAQRGIVRPFRDQAEAIAALVNDTKPSSWWFALSEERAFFAQICADLPIDSPLAQERLTVWGEGSGPLPVPTTREAELLALIDLGLSNQQIADHTNVSVGTIKWHFKNLYRKFGVSSRSAALARARAMGLLPK